MRRLLMLSLVAVGCVCCSPSPGVIRQAEDIRVQPHPTEAAPWDPRGVRFWIAGCNVGEDLWKYREHSTTVWCDPRGRELVGTEGRFDWPVYMASHEIGELIVAGEGLGTVEWRFWWGLDEVFVEERSLGATSSAGHEVRFDLAASPAWARETEHLLRLRLTWSGTPSSTSRVLTARGENEN